MDFGGIPTPNFPVFVPFIPYTALPQNLGLTNGLWLSAYLPFAPDHAFLAQTLIVSYYVNGTTNATAYWDLGVSDSASQVYGRFTTQTDLNGVIVNRRILVNKVIPQTSTYLAFFAVKNGSPGNIYVQGAALQGKIVSP